MSHTLTGATTHNATCPSVTNMHSHSIKLVQREKQKKGPLITAFNQCLNPIPKRKNYFMYLAKVTSLTHQTEAHQFLFKLKLECLV